MGKPWVIMQTCNNMPFISETLQKLQSQDTEFQLLVCDHGSTDGTVDEIRKFTDHLIQKGDVREPAGKMLNEILARVSGEIVVFLHPQSTPLNRHWLSHLISAMDNPRIAAVFSRQVARPDHNLIHIKDTEEFYGDGTRQKYVKHCFSIISSAIRRNIWEKMPFDESLPSEIDFYWTWKARLAGYTIRYVPDSMVMYSCDYGINEFYRRHYEIGRAEGVLVEMSKWDKTFLNYSLLPYGRQVLDDWKYCIPRWALKTACYAPVLRMAQMLGRRRGFKTGLKKRKNKK